MNNKAIVVLAVIIGLIFIYAGYMYSTHNAGSLPTYFPGHQAGSDHMHTKHAIAAFLLGIAAFILAWFQSGSKKPSAQ